MSDPVFLRSPALTALGYEHGFGTSGSSARAPHDLVTVRQVHGATLLRVPVAVADPAADALWTASPGQAVGVRTADCVPVLLAGVGRRVAAAVHAGWRGSALRISERVALALAESCAVPPRELLAVIGPHIGPCCYEVDAPVKEAIAEAGVFERSARMGHHQLDLGALNRLQLERAGLSPERILSVPGCTGCERRFDSYRRDGGPGRMVHFIRVPAA